MRLAMDPAAGRVNRFGRGASHEIVRFGGGKEAGKRFFFEKKHQKTSTT
jgi:hypothetical protein